MISVQETTKIQGKFTLLLQACQGVIREEEFPQISSAFEYASALYGESRTRTGELTLLHSLEISRMAVEEMGLGLTSVIAALFHDAVMYEFTSPEKIEETFGSSVSMIVQGFTRISDLPTDKVSIQSENFRKLFMALVVDIRVILLKLGHRLRDMRTIDRQPPDIRQKFHKEVLHIYIPIAHRLGLYRIKKELEELSMKFSNPGTYNQIAQKIRDTEGKRNVFIKEFIAPIQKALTAQGFRFEIKGRPKSIPSIWTKMQKQDVEFEQVFDLFAIRVILDVAQELEKAECWRAYSIVTNIYAPNPKRLRDWISSPKASGYESLHSTVKGPGDKWVEVQIRSRRMDEVAEKGQAAHWKYKGFGSKWDTEEWLNQVRDIIEHPEQISFDEMEEASKVRPSDKVFVFTPNGDLKELPVGATVLDFAFEVHTSVGFSCTGARINNKIVPIKQVLNNGDKVEILTSKVQRPKIDWLNYVISSKAKSRIRRVLKEDQYLQAEKGNEILRRKFRNWKLTFNDENIDKLIKKYKLSSSLDLYSLIFLEKLDLIEIKRFLTGQEESGEKSPSVEKPQRVQKAGAEAPSDLLIIDRKLDKVNYKLAKCCNPIPGDEVFGFVTVSRGISIHKKSCPNASQLLSRYGYRQIEVQWKADSIKASFPAVIRVTGNDKIGLMNELSQVISNELNINMLSLKMDARNGAVTGTIKVMVKSSKHLGELLRRISDIRGVDRAVRLD
jgi:GTP pyrophosphokinase